MSSSSVLVLDGAETAAALDPAEVLLAVRDALIAISDESVSAPPRIFARTPAGILGCMPAFVPGVGLAAKLVSVFDAPGAPGADGHRGRSTHFGLVALFDETDGRPLVIMEAGRLTGVRTAAAATLSMQALAPHPARIAIIGTGVQALAQLELLTALSTPADVIVGARDLDAARRLAATAPGTQVAPIRDAVRDADVVFCCTGATEPVIEHGWLAPGAHVSSVGGSQGHEVDAATVAAAEVYVEWRGAADQPPPAGAHELQGMDVDRVRLLGTALETGTPLNTGAQDRDRLTLFKSTGHAAFDVAAASVVHRLARERGLGRSLVF
jgi:ornithine cyclodeaminase/alanine dehydrogenase-like protein (mu-crystallin family)